MKIEEKRIPFREWETWVKITHPADPREGALPLIVLHGGPGMCHNYVKNINGLASTGRTVIHYDQLGCGNSTHLPDAPAEFWVPRLFVEEFQNLVKQLGIEEYHLLGQSWGGMLGAEIATLQPEGLRTLSICNSPAAMSLWAQGAEDLRAQLPPEVQTTLTKHEAAGTLDAPEYLAATEVFYERHVCRTKPMHPDFVESEEAMLKDPTVYWTMNGRNEFHVTGCMKDWTIIDRLDRITVPTLVVAGEFDEATPITWKPYVDGIANVRSHVFPNASHCSHLEFPEDFQQVVAGFLAEHDNKEKP